MPTIKTKPNARVMVGYPNERGDYESQLNILAHGLADEKGDFTFDLNPDKVQPKDATVRIRISSQETSPLEYKLKPFKSPFITESPDVEKDQSNDGYAEPDTEGILSEQPED